MTVLKAGFPADFIFGVADADLQVIGEEQAVSEEHCEETMWHRFAASSGKCFENQTPSRGIERYSRWQADIKLMQQLGVRHYRTSVSMARLLKRSGEINAQAADWYQRYFSALRGAGINVYATLYHWELPQFLLEQGGWKSRIMVEWLVRHASAVYEILGEYISEYFILNEPWCSSFLSYHLGVHAPGENDLGAALTAAHNLLLAQGAAFERLRSLSRDIKVSTVINVAPTYPASTSPEDQLAAAHADGYFNTWFLDPVFKGEYPQPNANVYARFCARASREDMALIQIGPRLSALGVNYYRGETVKSDSSVPVQFTTEAPLAEAAKNGLGWPVYTPPHYPEGLYDILCQIYYSYREKGLKRILLTENGMALDTPWDGAAEVVPDEQRIQFIQAHLSQIAKAVKRGVPVKGYFHWTLMDNYEWAEGYKPNSAFGLVHVDRESMRRVPKESARWYAANCLGGSQAAGSPRRDDSFRPDRSESFGNRAPEERAEYNRPQAATRRPANERFGRRTEGRHVSGSAARTAGRGRPDTRSHPRGGAGRGGRKPGTRGSRR